MTWKHISDHITADMLHAHNEQRKDRKPLKCVFTLSSCGIF